MSAARAALNPSRGGALIGFVALLLVATVLPAAADEVPAACDGRTIPLDEDEILVERTLYFHGEARLGLIDAWQDFQDARASRLSMDDEAPSSDESKVFASRAGGVGAPNSSENFLLGYWVHRLDPIDGPRRIVCAEVLVHAASHDSSLEVQLWVDQPRGIDGEVTAVAVATAQSAGISQHEGNYGELDVTAQHTLLVQLAPAGAVTAGPVGPPGALAFYDSVQHPSALTYVTVEKETS